MRVSLAGGLAVAAMFGDVGCGGRPAGAPADMAPPDAAAPADAAPADAAPPDVAPPGGSDGGARSPEAGVPIRSLCPVDGWCWENPLPQGEDIVALWGASPDDIWASTAEPGVLLRRARGGWTVAYTIPELAVRGLWGAASDDLWAFGIRWEGDQISSAIAHWDGIGWQTAWSGPGQLLDIAGSGAGDVWAVASDRVLHWDGSAWADVAAPPVAAGLTPNLTSVWPVAPDDVWAGGYGHLWRWDGVRWNEQALPWSGISIEDLWASGPDDAHAVGIESVSGVALRWDGTAWTREQLPVSFADGLWVVTGTGPSDVWIAGAGSSVCRFDGTSWHAFTATSGAWPATYAQALWAGPSFAIAGFQARGASVFDGQVWRRDMAGFDLMMSSVSGSAANDVWFASTTAPAALVHWDGHTLEPVPVPLAAGAGRQNCVRDVWAAGGGEVWFAGCGGLLGRRTPGGWTIFADTPSVEWNSIWGSAPDDVWAVGYPGTALHFDGRAWAAIDVPTLTPTIWPQQVRGSGRDDVWIVAGALMHWDGQRWSQADRAGDVVWANAPDDVWIAGALESIMEQAVMVEHWDGATWTSWYFPHNDALPTLWSPGRGEVWVAAAPSLRFREGGWQTLDMPTFAGGFWGSSTADVWAFGWNSNGILRRTIP